MKEEGKLVDPLQYGLDWGLVSVCLVVLVLVYYIVLFFITRKKNNDEDIKMLPSVATGAERLSLIKNKYANNIKGIAKNFEEDRLTERQVFQALSIELRNFTHEYSGSGAYSMTLSDLYATHAPSILLSRIEESYPAAFQEASYNHDVNKAIEEALKVVKVWR